jgi:hypothetical protein
MFEAQRQAAMHFGHVAPRGARRNEAQAEQQGGDNRVARSRGGEDPVKSAHPHLRGHRTGREF